jgi:NAD(P)-dependent dehydrogenase (short-subunit alcohol dehydrogenase family)
MAQRGYSKQRPEMSQTLHDRVAIITGAAGGIGRAIVERFAAAGAHVVLADVDTERVQAAVAQLSASASAGLLAVGCDVSDETAVASCANAALQRFGKIDIIVNNAGRMAFKPLSDWTREDWLNILGVDLLGPVFFTRAAFRHMSDGGSLINISSIHALATTPNVAPYAAAKAALVSLTRSAAIEGRERKIRANVILPGAIETAMLYENPNIKSGAEKLDPAYVGTPHDVASAALFLASDEARFITGTSLIVDGGRLVRL